MELFKDLIDESRPGSRRFANYVVCDTAMRSSRARLRRDNPAFA